MAKRGNFGGFGGFGGGQNMQALMRQAQKMQEQVEQTTAEIDNMEFTATAGGGMVSVVVTGKRTIKSLEIKPEVVDPEDVEILQDMILAAVNEAISAADKTREEKMNRISGGMGGLF
ncbi:MAG: YbaB/EbfC family nucleoid-associated protein [Eubacteriales bacterium]|nr:YbaB/EbfC family nucleoid-associated protein [Eubacteriales bacterium]